MALKAKINDRAEFDKLSDAIKAEYTEANGVWLLQTDEATELLAARNREKTRADLAEAEATRLKGEANAAEAARIAAEQAANDEKARKAGDIATLEKSWETRLNTALEAERAVSSKLKTQLETSLVDGRAEAIANEISTAPSLLIPVIRARLQPDLTGDKPILRVLDATGAISASTTDDLKKEVLANKEFAAIIKGTNASGGSANESRSGGSATDKKINDMTETERTAAFRADPDAFRAKARGEGLKVYG